MLDITARKRAEQALRDSGELWKRALESTGDGVWDWDLQAGVETYSPQCKALYGYADDELADDRKALDAPDAPRRHRAHAPGPRGPLRRPHPGLRQRAPHPCRDGQWKWILSRGVVIARDAAGRPLRMIGTHTDITAAKQAEALRLERDRAAPPTRPSRSSCRASATNCARR